jgi:exopolysaccharide biosynthesis polyprenyl glycosylphosphotransferase
MKIKGVSAMTNKGDYPSAVERSRQIVLLVGAGDQAARFIRLIEKKREWGIDVLGILRSDGSVAKKFCGASVLGEPGRLTDILHEYVVDRVIFFSDGIDLDMIQPYLYKCELEGVDASVALDFFDRRIARMRVDMVAGVPFLAFETNAMSVWQRLLKRVIDAAFSFVAIIVLSPLLVVTALAIKLSSPGPVFFVQTRVGYHGRKFRLFKFRSMYRDAEQRLEELRNLNEADGPVFKIRNDPRITSVGRLIRKLSIDELPQLFNVFSGDMSLVGPRPPLPSEVCQYEAWHRRRLSARPGLTCLWQISGRSDKIDFREWMRLDLQYLDNWSIWLDLLIVLRTIPVVLIGRGAY